jgi:MFS family permease
MAISISITPHVNSLWLFYCAAFTCGLGVGAYDCASAVWLIEIWKENCNIAMQSVQLAFGVGLMIPPLISKPFLFGELEEIEDSVNLTTTTLSSFSVHNFSDYSEKKSNSVSIEQRKSSLTWPFLIMGIIQLMAGVFQLIMFFYKRYDYKNTRVENINQENTCHNENDKKKKEMDRNEWKEIDLTSSKSSVTLNVIVGAKKKLFDEVGAPFKLIIFLGALTLATFNSSAMGHTTFAPTFSQLIPLKLTAPDAALVQSFFAISFTIGRVFSVFISLKLRPQTMLAINFGFLILAHVLFLLSANSRSILIAGNVLLGVGCSSFWPGFFAFIADYVVFTDNLGTIFMVAAGTTKVSCFLLI